MKKKKKIRREGKIQTPEAHQLARALVRELRQLQELDGPEDVRPAYLVGRGLAPYRRQGVSLSRKGRLPPIGAANTERKKSRGPSGTRSWKGLHLQGRQTYPPGHRPSSGPRQIEAKRN